MGREKLHSQFSMKTEKPTILVLSTGNSSRSQIAEGILKLALGDEFLVVSAGLSPAGQVHPLAIRAMEEIGIDIGDQRSKHLDEFKDAEIDTVITVCGAANQLDPALPDHSNRRHFPFYDPAHATGSEEEQMAVFRRIRDEILGVFGPYAAGRIDGIPYQAEEVEAPVEPAPVAKKAAAPKPAAKKQAKHKKKK